MAEFHKYVRTPHIRGSRFQSGDHDLEAVPFEKLVGKNLVIEEKCDGSNCGISFSEDGELLLQSRGHYLRGGPRERHFDLLKQWAACHKEALSGVLRSRYVMYMENMFAKHTIFYDALPHYFLEFDVLDTQTGEFLDTPSRHLLLKPLNYCPVLLLKVGRFTKLKELEELVTRSNFITDERLENLINAANVAGVSPKEAQKHTDLNPLMEGLYIKWEEDGIVRGRYKFVRSSFTNSILEQETHWHDRPIIQNGLASGALERMFSQ